MSITFNNLRNANETFIGTGFRRVTGGGVTFTNISASNVDIFADTGLQVNDGLYWFSPNQCNKNRGMRFHVQTAIAGTGITGVWEYRKEDSTWAAFTGVVDATNGFQTAGTNLDVTWNVPTDWGTNATALNTQTGKLWWRFRITAVTTITEGGRIGGTTPSTTQIYDNAIRVEDSDEYASGTATSGGTSTITDTSKTFTNGVRGRFIYIHTGTGAGQARIIKSNTTTELTIIHAWETVPDNTSQYRICSNFEDIYQADLAGGWGVVTRAGLHTFAFNCYLDFRRSAFGEINTMVEFLNDYYFYTNASHTYLYQFFFGWRLPLVYGLNKAVFGNTIIGNRTSPVDSRNMGFNYPSDYVFTADNQFKLRHDYPIDSQGYLREWFVHKGKYSIGDTFEGWRSTVYGYTETEIRDFTVKFNHSGTEAPQSKFDGVKSFYNGSLALFMTGTIEYNLKNFELGLNNLEQGGTGNINASPLSFYAYQGTNSKLRNLKPRFRPMADVFSATSNGISYPQASIRIYVTDENNHPITNARVTAKNGVGTLLFDVRTGVEAEFLSGQTVTSGGTYSLTNQPTAATKLRVYVTEFTDISSAAGSNSRLIFTGTDAEGNAIQEIVFIENIGVGVYVTENEFLTVSSIQTAGWTGVFSVGRAGRIYPQVFDFEKWQSLDDTTLTTTDYNPITITISSAGYETVRIVKQVTSGQDLHIPLKRSQLVIE